MALTLVLPGIYQIQHVEQPPMLITMNQSQRRHAAKLKTLITGTVGPEPIYTNKPEPIRCTMDRMLFRISTKICSNSISYIIIFTLISTWQDLYQTVNSRSPFWPPCSYAVRIRRARDPDPIICSRRTEPPCQTHRSSSPCMSRAHKHVGVKARNEYLTSVTIFQGPQYGQL